MAAGAGLIIAASGLAREQRQPAKDGASGNIPGADRLARERPGAGCDERVAWWIRRFERRVCAGRRGCDRCRQRGGLAALDPDRTAVHGAHTGRRRIAAEWRRNSGRRPARHRHHGRQCRCGGRGGNRADDREHAGDLAARDRRRRLLLPLRDSTRGQAPRIGHPRVRRSRASISSRSTAWRTGSSGGRCGTVTSRPWAAGCARAHTR